nr:hypothetical protein 1634Bnrm2_p075 [Cryptomonas sp.]
MIYLKMSNNDLSVNFLIEIFCSQNKLCDFSMCSIVKENILSQLIYHKYSLLEKNLEKIFFIQNLEKNEFFVKMGEKTLFLIGIHNFNKNSISAKKINQHLSIFQVLIKNVPFDTKIFLNSLNKETKNNNLGENIKLADFMKSQISILLFQLRKFKNSISADLKYFDLKPRKDIRSMIQKNIFLHLLNRMTLSNLSKNFQTLPILSNNKQKNIRKSEKYRIFTENKTKYKGFFDIILFFKDNIIFSIHRHVLFKIFRNLQILGLFKYNQYINIRKMLQELNIVSISTFVCKELDRIFKIFYSQKKLHFECMLKDKINFNRIFLIFKKMEKTSSYF